MNEKGYSWPEAILTLTILIVIFGTLLPLATKVATTLHNKKLSMYAGETAYQGAIYFSAYGFMEGVRFFDETQFDWIIKGKSICVTY